MTFLQEALAALFPFAGTWSPPVALLVGNALLAIPSTFVLSRQFVLQRRALTALAFVLMCGGGLYGNALARDVNPAVAEDLSRALGLAAAGQLVMGFLIHLLFGCRPPSDNRP